MTPVLGTKIPGKKAALSGLNKPDIDLAATIQDT
jgi:hypothetical protein